MSFKGVKLSEDDILSDIISEAQQNPLKPVFPLNIASNNIVKPSRVMDTSERDAQDYFKSLSKIEKRLPTLVANNKKNNVEIEVNSIKEVFFVFFTMMKLIFQVCSFLLYYF